jgi:hypothetical protein
VALTWGRQVVRDRLKRFEPWVYGAIKDLFRMFAARAVIVIRSCVRSTIRFKDRLQGPWRSWAYMVSLLSNHWWSGHGREFLRHPSSRLTLCLAYSVAGWSSAAPASIVINSRSDFSFNSSSQESCFGLTMQEAVSSIQTCGV